MRAALVSTAFACPDTAHEVPSQRSTYAVSDTGSMPTTRSLKRCVSVVFRAGLMFIVAREVTKLLPTWRPSTA